MSYITPPLRPLAAWFTRFMVNYWLTRRQRAWHDLYHLGSKSASLEEYSRTCRNYGYWIEQKAKWTS